MERLIVHLLFIQQVVASCYRFLQWWALPFLVGIRHGSQQSGGWGRGHVDICDANRGAYVRGGRSRRREGEWPLTSWVAIKRSSWDDRTHTGGGRWCGGRRNGTGGKGGGAGEGKNGRGEKTHVTLANGCAGVGGNTGGGKLLLSTISSGEENLLRSRGGGSLLGSIEAVGVLADVLQILSPLHVAFKWNQNGLHSAIIDPLFGQGIRRHSWWSTNTDIRICRHIVVHECHSIGFVVNELGYFMLILSRRHRRCRPRCPAASLNSGRGLADLHERSRFQSHQWKVIEQRILSGEKAGVDIASLVICIRLWNEGYFCISITTLVPHPHQPRDADRLFHKFIALITKCKLIFFK